MLVNSSLGFLNVLDRLTDLFNECGSLKKIDQFYHGVRNRTWLKRETYIFQYGYYYALTTTLVTVTGIYGLYMPFLFFACTFFLITKAISDGVTLICIYGKDVQGNGKLFESSLRKLHIGIILGHLVLMNRCYWGGSLLAFSINAVVVILSIGLQMLMKKWSVTDFKNMVYAMPGIHTESRDRIVETLDFRSKTTAPEQERVPEDRFIKPSLNDKADWVYKHTHPFIKNTSYCAEYIEHFNEPLGVPPRELKIEDPDAKLRFEIWLNKNSQQQKIQTGQIHVKSGDPMVNLPGTLTSKVATSNADKYFTHTESINERESLLQEPVERPKEEFGLSIPSPLTPITKQRRTELESRISSTWEKGNLKKLVSQGIHFESERHILPPKPISNKSTNLKIIPETSFNSP